MAAVRIRARSNRRRRCARLGRPPPRRGSDRPAVGVDRDRHAGPGAVGTDRRADGLRPRRGGRHREDHAGSDREVRSLRAGRGSGGTEGPEPRGSGRCRAPRSPRRGRIGSSRSCMTRATALHRTPGRAGRSRSRADRRGLRQPSAAFVGLPTTTVIAHRHTIRRAGPRRRWSRLAFRTRAPGTRGSPRPRRSRRPPREGTTSASTSGLPVWRIDSAAAEITSSATAAIAVSMRAGRGPSRRQGLRDDPAAAAVPSTSPSDRRAIGAAWPSIAWRRSRCRNGGSSGSWCRTGSRISRRLLMRAPPFPSPERKPRSFA